MVYVIIDTVGMVDERGMEMDKIFVVFMERMVIIKVVNLLVQEIIRDN